MLDNKAEVLQRAIEAPEGVVSRSVRPTNTRLVALAGLLSLAEMFGVSTPSVDAQGPYVTPTPRGSQRCRGELTLYAEFYKKVGTKRYLDGRPEYEKGIDKLIGPAPMRRFLVQAGDQPRIMVTNNNGVGEDSQTKKPGVRFETPCDATYDDPVTGRKSPAIAFIVQDLHNGDSFRITIPDKSRRNKDVLIEAASLNPKAGSTVEAQGIEAIRTPGSTKPVASETVKVTGTPETSTSHTLTPTATGTKSPEAAASGTPTILPGITPTTIPDVGKGGSAASGAGKVGEGGTATGAGKTGKTESKDGKTISPTKPEKLLTSSLIAMGAGLIVFSVVGTLFGRRLENYLENYIVRRFLLRRFLPKRPRQPGP